MRPTVHILLREGSIVRSLLVALFAFASGSAEAQEAREPIIDMHLHVRSAVYAGQDPPPMCTPFEVMPRSDNRDGVYEGMDFNHQPCDKPIPAASSDEQVMRDTLAAMEKFNIYGVVSGEPGSLARWLAAAPRRIIPAVDYRLSGTRGSKHVQARTTEQLRGLHADGKLRVIGEIMAQYEGISVDDPRMEPLWALAEELDIPVAIHMGPGEPGQPYSGGGYRVSLGDPLLLEPVLVRHPKLRVSIMHAGYPMADRMRALMFSYPQVYADIGGIVYTEPRTTFYRFLRELVDAGYGDRIMFGSDQMIWPGVIEPAIRTIEDAPFLTSAQKRDIFYNNAARFLRLSETERAAHGGR
ncbi:amidohydrolase family protein [Erythrobacter gaetbuli]|uniref:Amidohydrolase family protein n=2 Tax=Erythrobacteraceae TaxID=335929 RepID=A0A844XYH3_9SPHN|nr:amidohydrolase family protein [Qipengyuania gaetbuli]